MGKSFQEIVNKVIEMDCIEEIGEKIVSGEMTLTEGILALPEQPDKNDSNILLHS